jgi:hypothetical protein
MRSTGAIVQNHIITLDELLSHEPGKGYGRDRLLEITGGRTEITVREILELNIPAIERLEIVFWPNVLSSELSLLADCAFVEHVLPLWYAAYPCDDRIQRAIDIVRLYLKGEAGKEEIDRAHNHILSAYEIKPEPALVDADNAANGWSIAEGAGCVLQAADELTADYTPTTNYYISYCCFTAVQSDMIGKILKRDKIDWRKGSSADVNRVWDEADASAQVEFEWQAEALGRMLP